MRIAHLLAIALALTALTALAADPPKPKRTVKQIDADLEPAMKAAEKYDGYSLLVAGNTRPDPAAVDALRKTVDLLAERLAAAPTQKEPRTYYYLYLGMLAVHDEEAAKTKLEVDSASKVVADAACAKAAQSMAGWYKSWQKGEEERSKNIPTLKTAAKSAPQEDAIAMMVQTLREAHNKSEKETTELGKIVVEDLRGPIAQKIAVGAKGELARLALVGKPMTIAALGLDGKQFTSDKYKGKVILIDFWATWCGPCLQSLPELAATYKDLHEKGFEVIGVSSDQSADDLRTFLKAHPEMPWPQLFQPNTQGWHPLTKKYFIDGIPTMFLIDKAGVCRSVTARSFKAADIQKFLDEEIKK